MAARCASSLASPPIGVQRAGGGSRSLLGPTLYPTSLFRMEPGKDELAPTVAAPVVPLRACALVTNALAGLRIARARRARATENVVRCNLPARYATDAG